MCLDDFYRDLSALNPAARARVNFDDPAAIDWKSVRLVMAQLARGKPARVPVYDFTTHTRRRKSRILAPRSLVIWDGLWLLHHAGLRSRFAFSVFVGCDPAERFRRRCARDLRERGRSLESIRGQFARQVQPMHERFVEPQRDHACCSVASPVTGRQVRELASQLLQLCEPTARKNDE